MWINFVESYVEMFRTLSKIEIDHIKIKFSTKLYNKKKRKFIMFFSYL